MKTRKFTPHTTETPKRYLDPFAEGRDYANQWDWSAFKPQSPAQPASEPEAHDAQVTEPGEPETF